MPSIPTSLSRPVYLLLISTVARWCCLRTQFLQRQTCQASSRSAYLSASGRLTIASSPVALEAPPDMNRADNNNRPHRQDGSDNIAGGYTLGLPSLEVLLGPPSCTAPSKSFTRCESFEAETPLQSLYRSPPSFSGDVLTPPDPLLPSSPVQALAEAGIDENDDAAVFKLLMKQREKRRDAQLLPALPEPARETAVLLDNPLHNDPLGLYFKIASCQLNSASAVPVSE
ncbi:hypothetical protein CC85DRAFT_69481 [Cutaneotrichosporon oleaginosum]|uniref:Uncharacterized protein n=1 Tax=Cutaneotrichosporon oleaginosum TaxID=879819 RepID=A0A0J0XPF6_9TREE|nr:uncharacterized protein CC85DRAFT_69481 [Cutaneotrichosporon oleaginosum]KLT42990.1 hypothetical protein CC85DRAFT_69481 [Cutaneotrichosporon oleaginosum]TXT11802.1 hypothetical protein COLE_02212 [Cutaneotrichosporon oleaginosum]